jgi:hypothetical protein
MPSARQDPSLIHREQILEPPRRLLHAEITIDDELVMIPFWFVHYSRSNFGLLNVDVCWDMMVIVTGSGGGLDCGAALIRVAVKGARNDRCGDKRVEMGFFEQFKREIEVRLFLREK